MKKILVVFSLALFLSPLVANSQFSIAPGTKNASWLIHKIQAGEVIHDKVRVLNNDSAAGDFDVYPVDAISDAQGGFAPESRDSERNTVGKWVILKTSSVSIEPKNETFVDLTISVPEDTKSGEYTGAIMVQKSQKGDLQSGVNIATRVGVRVYITVVGSPNETQSLLEGAQSPPLQPAISSSEAPLSLTPAVYVELPVPELSLELEETETETNYTSLINVGLTVLVFILLLFVLYNTKRRSKRKKDS